MKPERDDHPMAWIDQYPVGVALVVYIVAGIAMIAFLLAIAIFVLPAVYP